MKLKYFYKMENSIKDILESMLKEIIQKKKKNI